MNSTMLKLRRTGKIALLLTILSIGSLFGMKRAADEHYIEADMGSELKPEIWGQFLPDEVKALIMVALAQSGNNLDEAINKIKKVSVLNKAFNQMINAQYGDVSNLQGFTQLVHILADKFGVTTQEVAEKFGTPVAKEYIKRGNELLNVLESSLSIELLKKILDYGVDVNYSYPFDNLLGMVTPMYLAMKKGMLEIIKVLLDSGVKLKSDEYYDTYDFWPHYDLLWMLTTKKEVKQLIDAERAKRQQ